MHPSKAALCNLCSNHHICLLLPASSNLVFAPLPCSYMEDYAEEAAPAPTKHSYLSGPSSYTFELANSDSETEDFGRGRK